MTNKLKIKSIYYSWIQSETGKDYSHYIESFEHHSKKK
jgi:hypothetical protein